jgi:hypothetical protein
MSTFPVQVLDHPGTDRAETEADRSLLVFSYVARRHRTDRVAELRRTALANQPTTPQTITKLAGWRAVLDLPGHRSG